MPQPKIMADLVCDHSCNNIASGLKVDKIIADMYRKSALAFKSETVSLIVRHIWKSGDAFYKVRINYVGVGVAEA